MLKVSMPTTRSKYLALDPGHLPLEDALERATASLGPSERDLLVAMKNRLAPAGAAGPVAHAEADSGFFLGPIDPLQVFGDLALLEVRGGLYRAPSLDRLLFGHQIPVIAEYVHAVERVAADSGIQTLVVSLDTPGGEIAASEVAEALWSVRASGKEVVAIVGSMALSMGYWLASMCNRILVTSAAQVGSIGVIIRILDASAAMAAAGLKWEVLRSTPLKDAAGDPSLDDEQRAEIHRELAELAAVFVGSVAKGRGVSVDVAEVWHDGRVHLGAKAVELGLADEVVEGSLASVVGRMVEGSAISEREQAAIEEAVALL